MRLRPFFIPFSFLAAAFLPFAAPPSARADWDQVLNGVSRASRMETLECTRWSDGPGGGTPCKKLSDIACVPGELDDGTGKSWQGSKAELKKRENERFTGVARDFYAKKKGDPSLRQRYLKYLQALNPEEAHRVRLLPDAQFLEHLSRSASEAIQRQVPGRLLEWGSGVVDLFLQPGKRSRMSDRREAENAMFSDFFAVGQQAIMPAGFATRIETEFKTVRTEVVDVLKRMIPPGKARDRMIDKVGRIQFGGTDCGEMFNLSLSNSRVDSLLVPNAFYDPTDNRFKYCNGLGLYNGSEFQRLKVIAHELTHSVDPCAFESMGQPFPAPEVVRCLRDPKSVGARKQFWFRKIKATDVEPLTACSGGDQIGEAFSDLVATEVLTKLIRARQLTAQQYRRGFANAMRFPSECKDPAGFDVHPGIRSRMDKIIYAHPDTQDLMDCHPAGAEKPRYCGPKKTETSK